MKLTLLPLLLCPSLAFAQAGGGAKSVPSLGYANALAAIERADAAPAAKAKPVVKRTVDPHIRYETYDADRVVRLTGYTGYQILIEFAPDERVETVGIGDSAAWQVTPNGAATVMFLKPVAVAQTTNLAIVTNLRRYNLELISRAGAQARLADIVYTLRFRYPEQQADEAAAAVAPPLTTVPADQWNRAYSFDGAKANVPQEMFDDGKATYFRFGDGQPTPAIFAVTDKSGEAIVNSAQRGPYIVVDQLAPLFVLRQGPEVTRIYNDSYAPPPLSAAAPRERSTKKKRGGLFGGGKTK
ncbi:MAG: TrbG/VirB9 family P-type conjugative transfer protein [Sphingomonas sp.]|jgi:type IV secretion system protein VirB9